MLRRIFLAYRCCKYIRHGINFCRTGVRFCNKLSAYHEGNVAEYSKDFYKNFTEAKEIIIKNCQNNIIPQHCQDCIYLEEKDWDCEDKKINEVEIFHWSQCNCACIYCSNRNETHLEITTKKVNGECINLFKTLKSFIRDGHFAKEVNISFVGGEPTLLKEFNDILKLFLKQNYKLHILTNGILYEKLYAKSLLINSENGMTISIDCGDAEMYKKVKGVDKFNTVTENIKRYIKESKNASRQLIIKYILIEGLNDTKENIEKWIKLCKTLGVKTLHPTIEFCHSVNDPDKAGPSEHICDMYNYMKEKIKENGFFLNTYDFVEIMVNKRSYR